MLTRSVFVSAVVLLCSLAACAPDDAPVAFSSAPAQPAAPPDAPTPAATPSEAVEARLSRDPDFGGPVRLTDVTTRSEAGWTVVSGLATASDGSPTDHCPDLDGDVRALLRQFDGQWEVVDYGACAGDVWWGIWTFRYGAPESLVQSGSAYDTSFLGKVSDTDDGFLSLRTEPSTSRGERVVKMASGEDVSVVDCQRDVELAGRTYGRWCQVVYHEQEGWAFSAYLY